MNVRRPGAQSDKPPAKQSWRKGAGAKPSSDKRWSSTSTKPDVFLSRGTKLFAAMVLLLATAGGVIAFLLRNKDNASMLVLAIDAYQYPWAPNAWAIEDADWFEDRLSNKLDVIIADQRILEQKSIDESLSFELDSKDFRAGGPGGGRIFQLYQTAIIYISAHMSVNDDGQPCIMTPSALTADPWHAVTPVPLESVFETISKHPKLNSSSIRGRRKLVVLDFGKQSSNMTLGLCNDAIHESIKSFVEGLTDRDLAVIVSCGENQRSWTAPELGGSNFGIWFANGLRGAADLDRSNRIDLKELVKYLKTQVNEFAKLHRAAFQEPVCYYPRSKEINFEIAFPETKDRKGMPKTPVANSIDPAKEKLLADQWAAFDTWKENEKALAYDPWRVNEVNNRLVRADQLLLAGPSHENRLKEEIRKITGLMEQPPKWPISIPGQSKVMHINEDWSNLQAEIKEPIRKWLDQVSIDGKVVEKPKNLNPEVVHIVVWNWLSNKKDSLNKESIKLVRELFSEAPLDSTNALRSRDRVLLQGLIERFHELMESSSLGDNRSTTDRLALMVKILEAHQQLEEAFGIQDPRLAGWLENEKQKGLLQAYLQAIDYWYVGSVDALGECDQLLEPLFGDLADSRKSKLIQASRERERLEKGWKLHDELVMNLPRMLWTIDNQSSLFLEKQRPVLRRSITRLNQELKKLHESLDGLSNLDESQFKILETSWEEMKRPFFLSFNELGRENEVDAATCRDILLWFDQPAVSSAERTERRRKLVEHLNSEIKEVDADEVSVPPPIAMQYPTLESWEENPSVTLVKEVISLDGSFSEKNPSLDSRYLQFHQQLWKGVLGQLNVDDRPADMAETIKRAWQAQVVAPWMAHSPSDTSSASSKCPTRSRWAKSAQLALLTLSDFAREDFWVLATDKNLDPSNQYFARLAENWMAAARSRSLAEGNLSAEIFKVREAMLQKASQASRNWKDDIWKSVPSQPLAGPSASITVSQPKGQPAGIAMLNYPFAATPESVLPEKPTNFNFDLARLTSSSATLKGSFRGRNALVDIPIKGKTSDVVLKWNVNRTNKTTINISADDDDHQILFVLDCSNSLSKKSLDKAKEQLLSILDRLPENTEVGLVVFGHSALWADFAGKEIEYNRRVDSVSDTSHQRRTPENDVDLLIPLEKKSEQTKDKFQDKLALLEPYGYTPLYFAIKFGLDHLGKAKKDLKQNLVVITDGENNVTIDGNGSRINASLRKDFAVPASQIKDTIATRMKNGEKLQLDVIAYEFQSLSSRELENIAGKDRFHIVSNESDKLLNVVRDILGLKSFTTQVFKADTSAPTSFGNSKLVELQTPSKVTIRIEGSKTLFEFISAGGESLVAKYDINNDRLRYEQLTESFSDACEVEIGKTKYKIGTLLGDRKGGNKYIRAAIQTVDPLIASVRPRRLWVELEVQSEDSRGAEYLGISDVEWELDSLAPVFRIPILNAAQEKIRVWFSFEDSKMALALRHTKWEFEAASIFKSVESLTGNPEDKGWMLSWKQPTTDRLAWSLDPPPDEKIEYTIGANQRQSYWYKDKPEKDIEIRIEKMPAMPAIDRDNIYGWSASKWLRIPNE